VKLVFADTFYWIALTLPGDAYHARAQQVSDDIVTEEVLTEYLTFFCAAPERLRRQVAMNVQAMLSDPTVRIIPQSHDSFLAGFDLYLNRPDKGYSLVDGLATWFRSGDRQRPPFPSVPGLLVVPA
jgi:hypothetical protein